MGELVSDSSQSLDLARVFEPPPPPHFCRPPMMEQQTSDTWQPSCPWSLVIQVVFGGHGIVGQYTKALALTSLGEVGDRKLAVTVLAGSLGMVKVPAPISSLWKVRGPGADRSNRNRK